MEKLEYIKNQLRNRFRKLEIKKTLIIEEDTIKIVEGTEYEVKIAKKFYPDYKIESRVFDDNSEERKIFNRYVDEIAKPKRIKIEFVPDYLADDGKLKNPEGKEVDINGREK